MAEGIRATPTIACTTSSLRNRSRCAKRRPPVSTVANKANAMSSTGIWLGEVRPSGNACANTWRTPRFSRYLITANQSTPAADRFARITHFQAGRCPPKSATVALHRPVPPSDFRCVSQLNDIKGVLRDDALPSFTKLILLGSKLVGGRGGADSGSLTPRERHFAQRPLPVRKIVPSARSFELECSIAKGHRPLL